MALAVAIVSAVISVVSMAISLSIKPPALPGDNGSSIDRKGQDNPKVVAFGRCMVPAVRVYNNVNNSNTSWLVNCHSLGVGEIKAINAVYIDGCKVFDQVAWDREHRGHGMFRNVYATFRPGRDTEKGHPQLIEHSDGEWTNNHRGDKTASIGLKLLRWIDKGGDGSIKVMGDRFKLECLVEGNKVFDPRYSIANRTWLSDNGKVESFRNPACVIYTYLRDDYYGLGLPEDAINVSDFIELANYCDANRLFFDGYIDQDNDFGKILLDMCSAADAMAYVEDGQVRIKADRLQFPVCHVTEDDQLGNFKLSNSNDTDYCNIVNVEFINTTTEFTKDKFTLPKNVTSDETIRRDGFKKSKNIQLPYTSDGGNFNTVRRIANKALKKAKHQQSIEFDVDNTKKQFNLMDVIEVTNADYGLNKKQFRVIKITTTLDEKTMVSKVMAEQYEPSVYDSSDYSDGVTSSPVNPPVYEVLSPVSLAFVKLTHGLSAQGKLSWTTRYTREHRTIVEYKLASSTDWKRAAETSGAEYTFVNLRNDRYDFRVRTVTFLGSTSEWAVLNGVQIAGGLTLPAITGASARFDTQDAIVKWDDMKGSSLGNRATEVATESTVGQVFKAYEIAVYKGAFESYAETFTSASNGVVYSYGQNAGSRADRRLRFDIRITSTDGSTSPWVTVRITNAQAPQPSGLVVNSELASVSLRWDVSTDNDYAGTSIHVGTTDSFTPSAANLVATAVSNSIVIDKTYKTPHFVKVGHFDIFGQDGMAYSAPVRIVSTTIDDHLTDSGSFGQLSGEVDAANGEITKAKAEIEKAKQDITANATAISKTNNTVQVQGAKVEQNTQAIASANGNIASLQSSVTAQFRDANAKIDTNTQAIATANSSMAEYKKEVTAEFNGVKGSISQNSTAITNANQALTEHKTSTTAEFKKANAAITANQTAVADANKALTAYKQEVTAEFNGVKGSISQNSTAIAGVDGKVDLINSIKLDSNGKVSGLIMGNNGETSTFDVIADKFRVSDREGSKAVFEVDTNSGRAMIRNALIGNLTASNIRAGAITGDLINSNTRIVAGSGNNVAVMDGAHATNRLYVGNANPAQAAFRVEQSGKLIATNAVITGAITATSGSFTGAINAQSGNFSGRINAANGAYVSGAANDDFLRSANGNFRVDQNGHIHGIGGEFKGKVYAEELEGDLVQISSCPWGYREFTIPRWSAGVPLFRVPTQNFEQEMVTNLIASIWQYEDFDIELFWIGSDGARKQHAYINGYSSPRAIHNFGLGSARIPALGKGGWYELRVRYPQDYVEADRFRNKLRSGDEISKPFIALSKVGKSGISIYI
ncbi:hypothetical protein [Edwardsiella tarda]|uniref:hypothetical protein n=1 Tax=Edwardsiella tarda TaxID=636 RepID=UPI00083AE83D|nr:hypothetical protein [Edwardsiella tarda]